MDVFRIFAGLYMLVVSFFGVGIGIHVIFILGKKQFSGSFYDICRMRSICNVIVCLCFLLWSAPCTLLNRYYLPDPFNAVISQLNGYSSYLMGLSLQGCASLNRFFAIWFPLAFKKQTGKRPLIGGFILCFTASLFFFVAGFRKNCQYLYNIELLSWIPSNTPCAIDLSYWLLYVTIGITIVSTLLNICTFIKMSRELLQISTNKSYERRMIIKSRRLLIQNLIQDFMYVVDMILSVFGTAIIDTLWSYFFCMSAVWLTHLALDGFVMYWYSSRQAKAPVTLISPTTKNTNQ